MSGPYVISGAGLVSAVGDTLESLERAVEAGTPLGGAAEAPGNAALAAGPRCVPIERFDPKRYINRRGLKDLSRTSQLACAAAAPIATTLERFDPTTVGVVLGTGWGSLRTVVDFEWESCTMAARLVDPLLFAETVSNVPAGQISIIFGWSAFNLTVSSGHASGLGAIREGLDLLRDDRAAIAVAGGADEINRPALTVLAGDGMVAGESPSLPFAAASRGLTGGEGACLFSLESLRHARARGAVPLARIEAAVGRFVPPTSDREAAGHTAVAELLRGLLDQAGLRPGDIQLVVASASGTAPGDLQEAAAIHDVFGDAPDVPCVLAPKAILGETWGASGPLAVALACAAMRSGTIPGYPPGAPRDAALPYLNLPDRPVQRAVRHAAILSRTDQGHLEALLLAPGSVDDGA